MSKHSFWDPKWSTSRMERVRDPREIPPENRTDVAWRPLHPCYVFPMFPAETMLEHCERELWKDGEALWIGSMHKRYLEQKFPEDPWEKISKFFEMGLHRSLDLDYKPEFGNPTAMPDISVELLPKMAWLSHEFILNDYVFDHPMCAHYDPRKQDNIIHPGGMRKVVLELYGYADTEVPVFFFNTGGFYDHRYMDHMTICDSETLRDLYFGGAELGAINGCLVADHGTLVPHLMVGSNTIHNRQQEYLTDMLRVAQSPWFKIFFNTPYPYVNAPYLDFLTGDHRDASVIVTIKNPSDPGMENKFEYNKYLTLGVIHALMNVPYEDQCISIVIKKDGFA